MAVWDAQQVYRFDRKATRGQIYAIDTPPPTVSGVLHIGSAFSYTHGDVIARYQRMRGKVVFYPMGWDDNGLPTERRVQNVYGVTCDPSLPYEPGYAPPGKPDRKRQVPISRRNFVELCDSLTERDEQDFRKVWQYLGLSVDWSLLYRTIGAPVRATSQRAFLRNLARGEAYLAEAPTLWDVTFQTAVAQAEVAEKEVDGAFHRVAFGSVLIETTRPELIPACVALVAHPDDERYRPYVGQTVRTPVFDVEVPVVAHELADPEKGSGIAMVCTFGDATDVTWWRDLRLPTRTIVGRDGRIRRETPDWLATERARAAYTEIAGMTAFSARRRMVELLRESGDLDGEPRPIAHSVGFYEKGDKPLEIVASRQWYIANGGRDADLQRKLIERGREVRWHPDHMRHRYENWVQGLTGDWLISRQRFYGVPVPVWYRLDASGEPILDDPILPVDSRLPVDPSTDTPHGYEEDQRGRHGGFIGDSDVLDTWATSSLTPQFAGGWGVDDDLYARVYPMDLRPQGQDIIRTWLFDTVVRAHFEAGVAPWRDTAISGFVLDPYRKKMGKSTSNAVTPIERLKQFGTDAFRYWACSMRLGQDTSEPTDRQLKVGRRLAVKILNVSKFALGTGVTATAGVATAPLDRALLADLAAVVRDATRFFDAYNYPAALDRIERFFWGLCDDYLELVKARAYDGDESARSTLSMALKTVLRLFAPFLPYVTEEVWSWWQDGSVHLQSWPTDVPQVDGDPELFIAAAEAIGAVRKAKSDAKQSVRVDVAVLHVTAPEPVLARLRQLEADLRAAGRISTIAFTVGDEARYETTLA